MALKRIGSPYRRSGSGGGYGGGPRAPKANSSKRAKSRPFQKNSVFIIMPFTGENVSETYKCIKEECAKLRLKATRVDESLGSTEIVEEIYRGIRRAEFIICDLTLQRPNVYYELGYAHGVGNKPLDLFVIAREGTQLHFDVAGLHVQFFSGTRELRQLIRNRFKPMVRERRRLDSRRAAHSERLAVPKGNGEPPEDA